MFPNKYDKPCGVCGTMVSVRKGFCYKAGRWPNGKTKWGTVCASKQCIEKSGNKVPDANGSNARFTLTADGKLLTHGQRPSENALNLIRVMPGARWNPDVAGKPWTVSMDTADRPRLLELADRLGCEVAPTLREYADEAHVVECRERCKAAGGYPYQVDGVDWISRKKRNLLADDMGLGKTMQVLFSLQPTEATLVVCPKALLYTWVAECKKWRPDLTPCVLDEVRVPNPGEVCVTNYDKVRKCLTKGEKVVKGKKKTTYEYTGPDMSGCTLVADECHRVKKYKTQQSIGVKGMTQQASRVLFLTGTPLPNRPLDLYGVLTVGGMEREVFGGWQGFVRDFNGYKGRWGYEFGGPKPYVPEKLRRVMLRRTKSEVLPDLPPKTYTDIHVPLPVALSNECDELWNEWGSAIDDGDLPPFEVFAGLRARLAQSRIRPLLDMVSDYEDSATPILVFSAHKAPIEALDGREGWRIITGDVSSAKRAEIVEDFQNGNLKGVGLTITAGGVGITLTHADTAIFVDLDWTPANNAQAEDRIARIGQLSDKVQIVRMVSDHVLDQHVMSLLVDKQHMIEAAIEELISYNPSQDATKPHGVDVSDETEEEWAERMKKAQRKVEERRARTKIDTWAQGQKIPTLSDTQKDAIRRGISMLDSVCDYALAKDFVGFNKPDAFKGKWLAAVGGPSTDVEYALAHSILRKYREQLGDVWDKIYS